MAGTSTSQQKKPRITTNHIETFTKVGSAISTYTKDIRTYTKEETKANMKSFWEQLLGVGEYGNTASSSGEMTEGQEILLSKKKKNEQIQQEAKPAIRAAYNYTEEILRTGETEKRETKEIEYKLHDIIGELQRLSTASAVLEKEVIEATGQSIIKPGKYHLHFFEWLLIEVRQARIQVEDAAGWLATVSKKNGKKKDYWTMYKQHGTKFGLSGERSVSTQTA